MPPSVKILYCFLQIRLFGSKYAKIPNPKICMSIICSPNRPTGPIQSSSRDVRPFICCLLLSPSHVILLGEQRRSQGSKAVLHRGISTLKKCTSRKKYAISPIFDASRKKNIGATIRIGREIRCLLYARFFYMSKFLV